MRRLREAVGSIRFARSLGLTDVSLGTGGADPVAAIPSAALMADHLGHRSGAAAVRRAVATTVAHRRCTPDLGGALATRQGGEAIRAALG
ncbi:isocitrate/isopropylmalate family dehydrogenase [Streptomyces sp. NPDC047841]|uniref:isocitrate/isopropylmalate family dehydrogenase n=1 Tax=Streptomyces sp. NPDC047841 TaxID=3154708 RepID=UPI003457149A